MNFFEHNGRKIYFLVYGKGRYGTIWVEANNFLGATKCYKGNSPFSTISKRREIETGKFDTGEKRRPKRQFVKFKDLERYAEHVQKDKRNDYVEELKTMRKKIRQAKGEPVEESKEPVQLSLMEATIINDENLNRFIAIAEACVVYREKLKRAITTAMKVFEEEMNK